MDIDDAVAKGRTGPPKDDEDDQGLDVWAGVLPLGVATGAPEPDPRLKPGVSTPDYLKDWRLGWGPRSAGRVEEAGDGLAVA